MNLKTNDEARRTIFSKVREHLAASIALDKIHAEYRHEVMIPPSRIPPVTLPLPTSPVDRFQEALDAVVGHSTVVRNEVEAAATLSEIIETAKARQVAVSDAALIGRVLAQTTSRVNFLTNCVPPALFDCDLGITSAQWAIAETGTLVLESEAEHHRLASLVPPIHVAIIYAHQVRQTLSEVLLELYSQGKDAMSRTVTFITGPSRTSDIELTLAIGVHGPAQLHVIIIQGEPIA
jgi:L-lactate dehydrogenase complex protein LldG